MPPNPPLSAHFTGAAIHHRLSTRPIDIPISVQAPDDRFKLH